MKSISPSILATTLQSCTEIGFRVSDGSDSHDSAIILGFCEGDSIAVAYEMLHYWANDLELIAVLQPRGSRMELSLIHTENNQVVVVKDLLFDEAIFADFMRRIPQNSHLLLLPCTNPVLASNLTIVKKDISPLVLIRYIVTASSVSL